MICFHRYGLHYCTNGLYRSRPQRLEVRLHDCCTAVFQSHLPQHSLQVCAFASRSSVSPHDRHTHYSNTFVLTLRVLQQLE